MAPSSAAREPVKGEVEKQDVDPPLTEQRRSSRPSVCSLTRARTSVLGQSARLGDARHLKQGSYRRDVRVEAAAGGGDQVGRHRGTWVLGSSLSTSARTAVDERATGRAKVRAAGGAGIVAVFAGGRRPAVEVTVAGEVLADQLRADHMAVPFDQAAVGLVREGHLGDARDHERIEDDP